MARNVYLNFIGGKWVKGVSGKTFEDRNPANSKDLIGFFPDSRRQDVENAVQAAERAYSSWRLVPPPRRGEIIMRAGLILEKRKEELARVMTREMGKVLKEARGDIQEAVDMAYYTAGEGRRLFGKTTTSELKNKFAMSIRTPIGVCGLITPWNFPTAIPSWKIFPALICGNTVVFKPAEDTPLSAHLFVEILEEAGLPPGVVNMVHGAAETGQAIVHHPSVRLISFTGSSDVGRIVAEQCGRALKRCSLEMGGKNAQIVMADADLDLAVEGAVWGAFGTTGQRCTATSRVYVEKPVFQKFKNEMVRRAKKIRIGNGLQKGIEMGPLINEAQRKRVAGYVKSGVEEGARLECGGKIPGGTGLANGYFFEPTIFTETRPDMKIIREEIFGPVTCIIPVSSFEDAVAQVNAAAYGLSSSVYSRDVNRAMRAIRDIEAGITYVNGPTIGAEVHLPFGGVKNTGNGHREAGETGLDIFSEWKSVFVDFSGKLQKAQIDTD